MIKKSYRVLILSGSDGHNDNRVFKQALAIKNEGYHVEMISRATDKYPKKHKVEGIIIHRVPIFDQMILDHQTHKLISEVLTNNEIINDVIEKSLTYKDYDIYFQNYKESMTQIRRRKPKIDQIVKKIEILWERKSNKTINTIKYNLMYLYYALSLKLRKTFLRKYQSIRDLNRNILTEMEKVNTKTLSSDCIFFLRPFWAYQTIVKHLGSRFLKSFDIIHVHDIYPLVAGYKIAKDSGAKLIYDAHEIEPERVPPLPLYRKKFIIEIEKSIIPYASKLITVGKMCEQYYRDNYNIEKTGVIFNTPEISNYTFDRNLKLDLRLSKNKKILLYVGAVGFTGRGIDKVLQALKKIDPEVVLVILGPRHKLNDQKVNKLAQELGVSERVILLPPVKPEQLVSYIKSADVGICPIQGISLSYTYCMPNKLFEMAFANLPICCSSLPEMKDFVENNNLGKSFDEKNPDSIAEVVNQLIQERQNYLPSKYKNNTQLEKYSWEHQKKKLLSYYEQALNLP